MKTRKLLVSFLLVLCLLSFLPALLYAVTVEFSTAYMTSIQTCPLDERTFVIAYSDDTANSINFRIYDTNGTQILAETFASQTAGTLDFYSVGVSAFNSTTFVISWLEAPAQDILFSVCNITGSILVGPITVEANAGAASYSTDVSCFNSTHFVLGWFNATATDSNFVIYDSGGNLIAGPTIVDSDVSSTGFVSVSAFNSTHFVMSWCDASDRDATFAVYDSNANLITGPTDADTDIGATARAVRVRTLNSTDFVMVWNDRTDQQATFAVYDSAGNLKTGPIDADTDIGASSYSVQVAALNSTMFVITWYDYTDFDLSFATYLTDGTNIAAITDIESWPAAANKPFIYNAPCGFSAATDIAIYGANWIIAYSNTTTQALWQAFYPNGTAWDGTIPEQGGPTNLTFNGEIPLSFGLSSLGGTWAFNRYGAITMTYSILSEKTVEFSKYPSLIATFNIQSSKAVSFFRESIITLSYSIDGLMTYTSGTFLNLFGIIPITFTPNSIRTWIFNLYPSIPFTLTPEGTPTFPTPEEQHGSFLQWLVSFIAFNLAQGKQPCINAIVIIYEMPANHKLLSLTTDENGKVNATLPQGEYKYIATYQNQTIQGSFVQTGEATVQLEFNIAVPIPLAKIGVGILIIGIGGIIIYNLNKQVKKKRRMRKPQAPEEHGEKRRKPKLKPKWKHPRPESEGYAQ